MDQIELSRLTKSFDMASDSVKQLITLATGIIAASIAIFKDGKLPSKAENLNRILIRAWVWLVVSIVFGILGLLALTGTFVRGSSLAKPGDVYGFNITLPVSLQILCFLIGVTSIVEFAYRCKVVLADERTDQIVPAESGLRWWKSQAGLQRRILGLAGIDPFSWLSYDMPNFDKIRPSEGPNSSSTNVALAAPVGGTAFSETPSRSVCSPANSGASPPPPVCAPLVRREFERRPPRHKGLGKRGK